MKSCKFSIHCMFGNKLSSQRAHGVKNDWQWFCEVWCNECTVLLVLTSHTAAHGRAEPSTRVALVVVFILKEGDRVHKAGYYSRIIEPDSGNFPHSEILPLTHEGSGRTRLVYVYFEV